MLRGYLILKTFVAVIVISILPSLFWNTLYFTTAFSAAQQNPHGNIYEHHRQRIRN